MRKHPFQTVPGCSGPKARPSCPRPVQGCRVSLTKYWLFCCCFWKTKASFQDSPPPRHRPQLISVLRTPCPWTHYCGFVQVGDLDVVISSPSSQSLRTLLSYDPNLHRLPPAWRMLTDPTPCLSLLPAHPCHQDVAVCKCGLLPLEPLPKPIQKRGKRHWTQR